MIFKSLTPQTKNAIAKTAIEGGGFGIAEFASMGVSLVVVAVADQLAPDLVKGTSKVVSKLCIEPFLDTIEYGLSGVCRLKECQPDKTKSREERAEQIAKTMLVFGAAWAASFGAKVAARRVFNWAAGIDDNLPHAGEWLSGHEKKILLADEGIHYGAILLMNTVGAPLTDDMITSTANLLEKYGGMSKAKAHEVASMAVVWEMPNVLGMFAGIGAIGHSHFKDLSHAEKIIASKAASTATAIVKP